MPRSSNPASLKHGSQNSELAKQNTQVRALERLSLSLSFPSTSTLLFFEVVLISISKAMAKNMNKKKDKRFHFNGHH
ncbi:unnamed protein product [Prunus armeniaca]|nr:hypothetical protein GBA52_024516 [Prunus armeniaca]